MTEKELLANIAPFGLRMQSDLKDRLKAAAERNNRSMNAEIIARLELSDDVEKLLRNFELAKEKMLSAQRIEAALEKQVEILTEALELERATNDKLLAMLGQKVEMGRDDD